MKRAFFITVSLFIVLSGLSTAYGHEKLDIAEFNSRPEAFDGRIVEVSAKVISISADSKSMELFDSESRTMIQVRLAQLPKAERSALMKSDVRLVSVAGRASMVDGRITIVAQKVEALRLVNNVADASAESCRVNLVN
jgi:hypothetical protein